MKLSLITRSLICCSGMAFASIANAGFSLKTSGDFYTVDTNAGVVFSVRRTDNHVSTQSAGDIASLKIRGQEYQNQSRGSQINAGFDWLYKNTSKVKVSAAKVGSNYIKITVNAGKLTHYYMARKGYPNIYMATYFSAEPDVHNHVRYILRMKRSLLNKGPTPSDISKTTKTVEAKDIFALSNGETRSKHYSNQRLKDWQYIGASGNNVGVWVVRDRMEGSSGGPFYRSLLNQGTSTDQEITYIVNYGQAQTESFRPGILNNYTLVVNKGQAPSTNIDTSWFSQMGLTGYVSDSQRGRVTGIAINNRDTDFNYTVGFANSKAQYWADANVASGYFNSDHMLPGTYEMTIYKNELAVDKRQVKVTAGNSTVLHTITLNGDPADKAAIWRIGHWDGSPQEFLNGSKLTTMHPSDPRMSSWNPSNFIVGSSRTNTFPAYIWKDINNSHVVYFRLNKSQRAKAHKLRIGITDALSGGRPRIKVNSWTSAIPSPSSQPKTRSLTTGSYRGNNTTFEYTIPASAWKSSDSDWNNLTIEVVSGTTSTGYLSPAISVDAIDLLK